MALEGIYQDGLSNVGGGVRLYYYVWIIIAFLIFAVAVYANINSLRSLHGAYLKGYYFQKECGDEYTEYESFRRQAYEALKNHRSALDLGSFLFLLLLFWVPLGIMMLGLGHMLGVSAVWVGVFVIVIVYYIFVMSKVVLERNESFKMFEYFKDANCSVVGSATILQRYKGFQLVVFLLGLAIAYGYFTLQSKTANGTIPVFINRFPSIVPEGVAESAPDKYAGYLNKTPTNLWGFGYKLFLVAQEKQYLFYTMIYLWLVAFLWLYFSNQLYYKLRQDVLCHYEMLMDEYKSAIQQFLMVDDIADDQPRFNYLKEHIERNYLRIHGVLPPPILDRDALVRDYSLYLMNWKGREFETFESSNELNALRDLMYRLRNDKVYSSGLKQFFSFAKWYYWVQFVVVLYVVFHSLYQFLGFGEVLTVGIAVGGILLFFVLSWYAWFDVALYV